MRRPPYYVHAVGKTNAGQVHVVPDLPTMRYQVNEVSYLAGAAPPREKLCHFGIKIGIKYQLTVSLLRLLCFP